MKLQKLFITGLLVTAFSGLSAGSSQALSCAEGFEPMDDTSMTECVPVEIEAIAYSATDGEATDPEAISSLEEPVAIDENGCWTQTDADGNSVDVCTKGVDISLEEDPNFDPTVGCGVVTDESGNEMPVCADGVLTGEEMYQTGVPELRNDVELTSAGGSQGSESSSNTLAALGVLVAAAGAFGIGLSRERSAKK